jgi:serine/threonine-protein kinase RsbW
MLITLQNDLAELPRLDRAVQAFRADRGLSEHDGFELGLVLEEVFVNIVRYAFDDGSRHTVGIRLDLEGDQIVAEVTDAGRAFDPRDAAPPDLAADLDHRPIGGLGIHFIRKLTQELAYERRAGINHLSFRKRIRRSDGD